MALRISPLSPPPVSAQEIEIVERKGLGHPDTICDAVAEKVSIALSRYYLERFGLILHHNVDKALVRGGAAQVRFGGGSILQPIDIYLAGRATHAVNGNKVPVEEIAVETARQWFKEHLPAINCDKHLRFHCLIRPGSSDLVNLYLRQKETGVALANDTSCGVGYAPVDELEQLVYAVERQLNSPEVKSAHPAYGEDIKVMAVREDSAITLTIACAFISRHIHTIEDYLANKARLTASVLDTARRITASPVAVHVNTADQIDSGSVYLTVTGTSAEAGDDGEVGRGNRANGLITPYRPMTMEAVAGKNPVTHVGKLYNVTAMRIAASLVREIAGVGEAYCYLVSEIGKPIQEPRVIDIRIRCEDGRRLQDLIPAIEDLVRAELAKIGGLWREFVQGDVAVY
jgi:S-adenosylmethionine synthetase